MTRGRFGGGGGGGMCPFCPPPPPWVRHCECSYNFRYTNILQVPHVKTTKFGKNSFRYAAPVLWNSLPENFRNTVNFNQFKSFMSSWNGEDCNCTACKK